MMYIFNSNSVSWININNEVFAIIKGEIVRIDLASEDKNSYMNIDDKEYLGSGVYYSYGKSLATDKRKMHFWNHTIENVTKRKVLIKKNFNSNIVYSDTLHEFKLLIEHIEKKHNLEYDIPQLKDEFDTSDFKK